MRFHLRTLSVAVTVAALAICAFLFWDASSVRVAPGHRGVTVSIVRTEPGVPSVSFTTSDANTVQTAYADATAPEPIFKSIQSDSFTLDVPFSSKVSRIGRDLGYSEAFDRIVFRIAYENKEPEIRIVRIPTRSDPAKIEIKL